MGSSGITTEWSSREPVMRAPRWAPSSRLVCLMGLLTPPGGLKIDDPGQDAHRRAADRCPHLDVRLPCIKLCNVDQVSSKPDIGTTIASTTQTR